MNAIKQAGLALILGIAAVSSALAQETTTDNEWNNTLLSYLWVVGVSGDAEVGGMSSDVDIDFADILDQFNAGVSIIYEGYNKDWMVLLDGTFLSLESNDPIGGIPATAKETFTLIEGGIGHRITKAAFPKALVGFRYIAASVEIDSELGSADSGTKHILDPIVGIYHKVALGERWGIRAIADIGGFGVGTEMSYGAGIGTYYKFKRNWGAEIGYRFLKIDYEGDAVEFDGQLNGAYLGISKRF